MINTIKNRTLFIFSIFILASQSLFSAPTIPFNTTPADPCALLIGVKTYADCDGELGAFVESVVEGSLAAQWGFLPGDIIVSMDKYDVDTPDDLVQVKNYYHPGDKFSIQFIRKGVLQVANMQFPNCADLSTGVPGIAMSVDVVPNPSHGQFQLVISDSQDAVQIQITTIEGQVVLQKTVPAGFYKESVQLGQRPGMYILTAVQGDQVISHKIVVTAL